MKKLLRTKSLRIKKKKHPKIKKKKHLKIKKTLRPSKFRPSSQKKSSESGKITKFDTVNL